MTTRRAFIELRVDCGFFGIGRALSGIGQVFVVTGFPDTTHARARQTAAGGRNVGAGTVAPGRPASQD